MRAATAVCVTGALRWPEITLSALRHMLLLWQRDASHVFFVGPADAAYRAAMPLPRDHLQVPPERVCAYPPNISWVWRPPNLNAAATRAAASSATFSTTNHDGNGASTAFSLHGSGACQGREQLKLNVAWLPFFRRCRDARFGFTKLPEGLAVDGDNGWKSMYRYERARAMPCSGAISLVMQLWQCARCLELIEEKERTWNGIFHDKILRVRADLFFFRPVALPHLGDSTLPRFSLMESTCNIEAGLHEMARKLRPQFFQDFWAYGTRPAMRVLLREPLRRLLIYGLQQANRSVHYVAAVRRARRAREANGEGIAAEGNGEGTGGLAGEDGAGSSAGEGGSTGGSSSSSGGDSGGSSGGGGALPISPKAFAVHPVLYGLHFDLNASSCVPFEDPVGLLRINPHEGCFGVQARIKYASLSGWMQLSVSNLTSKWHRRQRVIDEFNERVPQLPRERLPDVAKVYADCLGLRSEQSCPRVIGDKMLRNGPAADCFRNRTDIEGAKRDRSHRGQQLVGPRVAGDGGCGVPEVLTLGKGPHGRLIATSDDAFMCMDDGLAKIYTGSDPILDDFYARSRPHIRQGGLAVEEMAAYWAFPSNAELASGAKHLAR